MSATGGYGYHPTAYVGFSDDELYAQFREKTWKALDEAARQDLLQEVVNRSALAHGELGSCKVEFADLKPTTAGEHVGDTIRLNREMYANDRQLATWNGTTIERPLADANLRALTTVLHEDEHAYQDQVIAGLIPAGDAAAATEYASNDFARVPVVGADGSTQWGCTYLRGETPGPLGYYLYYLQSTERDAHLLSEAKCAQIMASLEARFGTEPSFEAYRATLAADGYAPTLAAAQQLTGVPDIERQVNLSLMNHYYGTSYPVSPQVEALVSREMVLTNDALARGRSLGAGTSAPDVRGAAAQQAGALAAAQTAQAPPPAANTSPSTTSEEAPMAIDWHVSYEEYDQTLRDTVNAYYEHALNDPTMSHDEALASTGKVAEGYLQASEEFAEAQQAQEGSGAATTGAGLGETTVTVEHTTTAEHDEQTSNGLEDLTEASEAAEPGLADEGVLGDEGGAGLDDGGIDDDGGIE